MRRAGCAGPAPGCLPSAGQGWPAECTHGAAASQRPAERPCSAGGIKPCVAALTGDQFSPSDPRLPGERPSQWGPCRADSSSASACSMRLCCQAAARDCMRQLGGRRPLVYLPGSADALALLAGVFSLFYLCINIGTPLFTVPAVQPGGGRLAESARLPRGHGRLRAHAVPAEPCWGALGLWRAWPGHGGRHARLPVGAAPCPAPADCSACPPAAGKAQGGSPWPSSASPEQAAGGARSAVGVQPCPCAAEDLRPQPPAAAAGPALLCEGAPQQG